MTDQFLSSLQNCHNERVAKNRRHQEQKRRLARKEKEKEKEREREKEVRRAKLALNSREDDILTLY